MFFFFNYYRTTTEVGWDYRVLIAIHPPRPYGDVTAKASPSATHAACITNCTRYCKKKKKLLVNFFPFEINNFYFKKFKSLICVCFIGEPTSIHEERRNPNSKTETQNPRKIQVSLQRFPASLPTGALACPSHVHPAPGDFCLPPSATLLPGAVGFVRGTLRSRR